MIPNPTSKGKTSEAMILAALVKLDKYVLIPWGERRYDLALDDDGRLVRIQCKTGNIRDGCVNFKTSITDARRPSGDGGYAGQIDAFAVYCPQNRKAYLIPIEAVRTRMAARLRIEPAKNGQIWNVRWARDFELPDKCAELIDLSGRLSVEVGRRPGWIVRVRVWRRGYRVEGCRRGALNASLSLGSQARIQSDVSGSDY